MLESESDKIVSYIIHSLNLPQNSVRVSHEVLISPDYPIRIDIMIEENQHRYYVEIKKRLTLQALEQVTLQQALLKNEIPPGMATFIIATPIIPEVFHELAYKTGINLIKLPHNLIVSDKNKISTSKTKLTADKSWRVVTRLLKEKTISIRQIALQEGISYGLSHKVVRELLDSHIATKDEYYIRISDVSSLLNIVAWERSLKKLKIDEFWLPHENAHTAAREITHVSEDQKIPFACNSFTAAGIYTGYAVKHNEVHFYLNKEHLSFFKSNYGEPSGSVKAVVYHPDRDILFQSRIIEGIQVTSPGQTLLDIAGMGYSGINLAKQMVEIFDHL